MISYEDLDLRIEADGRQLFVAAQRGSQRAKEPFTLDLSRSWNLERLEKRGTEEIARHGAMLFKALIHGTVRDLYQQGRGGAGSDGEKGLRIRIHIDVCDKRLRPFADIPWELMHDGAASTNHQPAFDARRPIVRMIDTNEPPVAPVAGPLERVLLVTANPSDTEQLDLESECRRVKETLDRTRVTTAVLSRATPATLRDRICEFNPQIVHFMGHGSFDSIRGEGTLLLEGPEGLRTPLRASEFTKFFVGRAMPRLVVLNSCLTAFTGRPSSSAFSSIAAALVAAGLPTVLAMQSTIRDKYAGMFADVLYRALVTCDAIEDAITQARVDLHVGNPYVLDWAVPVLYVRAGTPAVMDRSAQPTLSPHQPHPPERPSFQVQNIYGAVIFDPTGPVTSTVDAKKNE